ncbi:unnamed protein product [Ostreobium quekettii]|uniref:Uncharacterized protein n=1 Tax=Ostreobium quekettii TaxID=121088 RepID=A0A8S1IZH2_9CHLO|nr:unnamed protein product [Ostreobium quekettii]|eukprot:evm.model.scf_248EXC.7 EVM.evm.TU.scf_248EXC.7   scf_248EXC:45597-47438(-)
MQLAKASPQQDTRQRAEDLTITDQITIQQSSCADGVEMLDERGVEGMDCLLKQVGIGDNHVELSHDCKASVEDRARVTSNPIRPDTALEKIAAVSREAQQPQDGFDVKPDEWDASKFDPSGCHDGVARAASHIATERCHHGREAVGDAADADGSCGNAPSALGNGGLFASGCKGFQDVSDIHPDTAKELANLILQAVALDKCQAQNSQGRQHSGQQHPQRACAAPKAFVLVTDIVDDPLHRPKHVYPSGKGAGTTHDKGPYAAKKPASISDSVSIAENLPDGSAHSQSVTIEPINTPLGDPNSAAVHTVQQGAGIASEHGGMASEQCRGLRLGVQQSTRNIPGGIGSAKKSHSRELLPGALKNPTLRAAAARAATARREMRKAALQDLNKSFRDVEKLAATVEEEMIQAHKMMQEFERSRRMAHRNLLGRALRTAGDASGSHSTPPTSDADINWSENSTLASKD